jgi:DNA-binding transcriptional ArsR family regulator
MIETRPAARDLMACLGDRSRFELVKVLISGPRCVSDLAVEVGLSQSCTTRHLQALERRNVVLGTRDGKRVLYALRQDRADLMPLIGWAMESRLARPPAPAKRAGPAPVGRRQARSRNGVPSRDAGAAKGSSAGNGGGAPARNPEPAPTARPPEPGPNARKPEPAPVPPALSAAPAARRDLEPEPSPRRRSGDLEDFLL